MNLEKTDFLSAEEVAEEDIVERIFEAVIDQQLPPGTKLSESALCEAFGVGRMRIRRSLLLLASREVVELHPNKGAFVASPSADQAREVFEARLALEPTVACLAVQRATSDGIAALKAHLKMEYAAHRSHQRRDAIRLSGQFHTLMAQLAGNTVMLRMTKELVTRSSLIIGMYGSPGVTNCRDDDHAAIVDAFQSGDGNKASSMMRAHLSHIEKQLDLESQPRRAVDLVGLFGRSKRG
jgi:DNA-binding GntR family transcriptional regulator